MKYSRDEILKKTNGHCAYCGIYLNNKFQVDHIIPKRLVHFLKGDGYMVPRFLKHLLGNTSNIEHIDNLLPSCPQCNNFKSHLSLEEFRNELENQVERARKYSVNFRFAEKYELIEIKKKEIVFYFEK